MSVIFTIMCMVYVPTKYNSQNANLSSKNSHNAKLILQRVKNLYGFSKDADLANFLQVSPSTISTWRKRDSIDWALLFAKCKEADLNFLVKGEKKAPSGAYDNLVNQANDSIDELEYEAASLSKTLPASDHALELLKSSVRLIQSYIDSVEGHRPDADNNKQR